MPSGSGWDNGTKIDLDKSDSEKLVFYGGFHHMDEDGYYTTWTKHTITVTPSLQNDIDIKIGGKSYGDIKECLYESFMQQI